MQKLHIQYAFVSKKYPWLHYLALTLLAITLVTMTMVSLHFENLLTLIGFIPCLVAMLFFRQASTYKAHYLSHQN